MPKTFYYFAYGSNLLTKRMHMSSPNAVRVGCGQLKDYRLDFNSYSNLWKGAAATVVPTKNKTVWGAVWEIDIEYMPNLDRQEGVDQNFYFPLDENIEMLNEQIFKCRLYQMVNTPPLNKILPPERLPSTIYLDTMIRGAIECNIPEVYQNFLRNIPTNGYKGTNQLRQLLSIH